MNVIYEKRCSGKTLKLVCLSYAKRMPIICLSDVERKYILDMAHTLQLDIPNPIVYNESDIDYNIRGYNGLLIDNADCILKRMFAPCKIDTITISKA